MRLDLFAREQFESRLAKLSEQLDRAHHDATVDAVHDLRVANRRFSQVLIAFAELLPASRKHNVIERLKKIMSAAGRTRDLDIALELVGPRAPAEFRKALEARRWKSAAKLAPCIERAVNAHRIAKWQRRLACKETSRSALPFARSFLLPMERAFLDQGDDAAREGTSPEAFHRFRIAAKKLRFTLELFAPLDDALAPRMTALRAIQQILGEANDCVVAAELVTTFRGPATIERRLLAQQRRLAAQFRRIWPKARTYFGKSTRWRPVIQ